VPNGHAGGVLLYGVSVAAGVLTPPGKRAVPTPGGSSRYALCGTFSCVLGMPPCWSAIEIGRILTVGVGAGSAPLAEGRASRESRNPYRTMVTVIVFLRQWRDGLPDSRSLPSDFICSSR